jgi:prepilin-type processing-associated H-X9-DG protein
MHCLPHQAGKLWPCRFETHSAHLSFALFVDGHVDSFRWQRPGFGGSDLQFKNFILDDLRRQDMIFLP